MKRILISFGVMLLISSQVVAQTVTGSVTDANSGEVLPGVNIMVKGTTTGTTTNTDGNYELKAESLQDTLVASFVGFQTKEIPINGRTQIDITLMSSTIEGEEMVVVGYGTQEETSVTGSISSVGSDELTKAPLSNASNLVRGKLPGVISTQRSGQPGADAADLNIRGFGDPLVIVDGVERNLNALDPNQIESISVLKDASAAIYGARAGNGVILVTTKRGFEGKPTFNLSSSVTVQGNTRIPEPVSAGQYAEMEREEWIQSGNPPESAPYTAEEVQKFYEGTDPQYPNTDWQEILMRDWAPQQQHDLSVRGGSENIQYYALIGFLDQRTVWTESGGKYERYNLQSNIDAQILDNLSLRFDISGTVEDRNFSARGWDQQIWTDFWETSPTVPAEFPDTDRVPMAHVNNSINAANVTTNRDLWGYDDSDNQDLNGALELNYQFEQIEGLFAKGFINYHKNYGEVKNFAKPIQFWEYDYASETYFEAGSRPDTDLSHRNSIGQQITGQLSLNYENSFAEKHNISALGMYEAIDSKNEWIEASRDDFITPSIEQLFAGSTEEMRSNGAASEMGRVSYIGRLAYNYDDKYLFESTFRADASAKFNADNRWGYFPGVSLGWRIAEEGFMDDINFLDELKLRASYGQSGDDNVGNFQYLTGYTIGDTYMFSDGSVSPGISSTGIANPSLTWEEITIYNAGLDYGLFEDKLYGKIEVFYRERSGIPANRFATLPNSFGASLPAENLNSLNDRGFELQIATTGNVSDFSWDVSGNLSWSRSKWDHFEEPEFSDEDEQRINKNSGRWTDQLFGYISDGLFTSQEEIDELEFDQDQQGNSTLRPGDVRYVDVNDDGELTWRDQVEIGKDSQPNWTAGLSANLGYKNFTLSMLFQGAFGHYKMIDLNPYNAVSPVQRYNLRWTPENNDPNALVPRLGGSGLNNLTSDYRLKPSGYVRLKTVNLGYSVPHQWLQRIANISRFRVYISGTNLLTTDRLKKYGVDPEMPSARLGTYYPQQRTLSFGADISF